MSLIDWFKHRRLSNSLRKIWKSISALFCLCFLGRCIPSSPSLCSPSPSSLEGGGGLMLMFKDGIIITHIERGQCSVYYTSLQSFRCWLFNFGDFYWILIGWFIKFQPPILIYRRFNFVYHYLGVTSIYQPLSYPFNNPRTVGKVIRSNLNPTPRHN